MTTKEWIAGGIIVGFAVVFMAISVKAAVGCRKAGGLPVLSLGYVACAQEHKP